MNFTKIFGYNLNSAPFHEFYNRGDVTKNPAEQPPLARRDAKFSNAALQKLQLRMIFEPKACAKQITIKSIKTFSMALDQAVGAIFAGDHEGYKNWISLAEHNLKPLLEKNVLSKAPEMKDQDLPVERVIAQIVNSRICKCLAGMPDDRVRSMNEFLLSDELHLPISGNDLPEPGSLHDALLKIVSTRSVPYDHFIITNREAQDVQEFVIDQMDVGKSSSGSGVNAPSDNTESSHFPPRDIRFRRLSDGEFFELVKEFTEHPSGDYGIEVPKMRRLLLEEVELRNLVLEHSITTAVSNPSARLQDLTQPINGLAETLATRTALQQRLEGKSDNVQGDFASRQKFILANLRLKLLSEIKDETKLPHVARLFEPAELQDIIQISHGSMKATLEDAHQELVQEERLKDRIRNLADDQFYETISVILSRRQDNQTGLPVRIQRWLINEAEHRIGNEAGKLDAIDSETTDPEWNAKINQGAEDLAQHQALTKQLREGWSPPAEDLAEWTTKAADGIRLKMIGKALLENSNSHVPQLLAPSHLIRLIPKAEVPLSLSLLDALYGQTFTAINSSVNRLNYPSPQDVSDQLRKIFSTFIEAHRLGKPLLPEDALKKHYDQFVQLLAPVSRRVLDTPDLSENLEASVVRMLSQIRQLADRSMN